MNFIQQNLSDGERIIAEIKHKWVSIVAPIIGFILFVGAGIALMLSDEIAHAINKNLEHIPEDFKYFFYLSGGVLLLFGVIFLLSGIFEIKSAQLVLTDKRLLGRRGFIRKVVVDIMLSKIDTVVSSNGLLGGILNYGNIKIITPGTGAKNGIVYTYVSNGDEFRKAVLKSLEQNKMLK